MTLKIRRRLLALSVVMLIVLGYVLARYLATKTTAAWMYVTFFYGGWLLLSLGLLLRKSDIKQLLQPGRKNVWYIIPCLYSIPLFFLIFIPNGHVLKPDMLLAVNIFICIFNPWLEELYWRGLVYQLFKESKAISFLLSAIAFGLSHALIFGINSPGVAGLLGFIGAFIVGATWWYCLRKTASLRGAIITHFLIDVAGLAAYVLANKLILMKLPAALAMQGS